MKAELKNILRGSQNDQFLKEARIAIFKSKITF